MNMRFFLFGSVLLFLALFTGCRNSEKKSDEDTNGLLKTIIIPKPLGIKDVDIIENLEFITLEATDKSLFGVVSKMRIYQDRIYILDAIYAAALFIYTMDGKHLATIGDNKGGGPFDFVKLFNFEIDYVNNQLLVMDSWGQKFMIYDLDGNFIKRVDSNLHVTDAVLLPNGYIVHAKSSDEHILPGQSNSKIFITDDNQNIIKEGFEYDDNKNINIHSYGIIRSSLDGDIVFAPRLRDTIYSITFDSITPKYAIDYGVNKKVSQSVLNNIQRDSENPTKAWKEFARHVNDGYLCFLGNNVESDDYLYLYLGHHNNIVSVFYNKKTNRSIAVSLNYYTDEIVGLNIKSEKYKFLMDKLLESEKYNLLCADSDGYFYGALNESLIEAVIRLHPELKDLDNPEDMNPILFRYKIKNEK